MSHIIHGDIPKGHCNQCMCVVRRYEFALIGGTVL